VIPYEIGVGTAQRAAPSAALSLGILPGTSLSPWAISIALCLMLGLTLCLTLGHFIKKQLTSSLVNSLIGLFSTRSTSRSTGVRQRGRKWSYATYLVLWIRTNPSGGTSFKSRLTFNIVLSFRLHHYTIFVNALLPLTW
jgi:hypothetical protein